MTQMLSSEQVELFKYEGLSDAGLVYMNQNIDLNKKSIDNNLTTAMLYMIIISGLILCLFLDSSKDLSNLIIYLTMFSPIFLMFRILFINDRIKINIKINPGKENIECIFNDILKLTKYGNFKKVIFAFTYTLNIVGLIILGDMFHIIAFVFIVLLASFHLGYVKKITRALLIESINTKVSTIEHIV